MATKEEIEQDRITIGLLKNLIVNIEAGHITTVCRDGEVFENDMASVRIVFKGKIRIKP